MKILLTVSVVLSFLVSQAYAGGSHEGGYRKPGAGVYIQSPKEIQLEVGEAQTVNIELSNPSRASAITLTLKLPEELECINCETSWVFAKGQTPKVTLTLKAQNNGRYHLMFDAERKGEGMSSFSVTGIPVQVGEAVVKMQQARTAGGVKVMPAEETIIQPE